jgi:YidC/Oxa1 family membrane protein insertase
MLYIIPLGTLASGLLFNFPLGVLMYWFVSNLWTLGQQAYIIRFHPHDEPTTPERSEAAKVLAPKPGQKPVRLSKPTRTVPEDMADSVSGSDGVADERPSTPPPAKGTATPRPGQKPNRSGGKKPPNKRPTQAKKRR